jgi:hypothetical protein
MTQRHPLSTLIDFLRDTSSRTGRTTSSRPTPTEPTSNSATVNSAPGPKNPFTNEPYQDAIKAATQEIRKARDEWDRAPGYSEFIDGLASALGAGPVTGPVTDADEPAPLESLLEEIAQEVERAQDMHAPMHSLHEGYAVLKEELDELWDEVRMKHPDFERARKEAIQCAAMAVRLVLDVDRVVRGPT